MSKSSQPILVAKDVQRSFKSGDITVTAIDSINLTISAGTFVSIVGRSGSGKSTLLTLLGALDMPSSGTISVDDQDITKLGDSALIRYRNQKIGFVFQGYNLVPNLTALENVMLPMEFNKVPKAKRIERATTLLEQVGLTSDQIARKPTRLSGGQQQRVAIARSLANQPKVILADEPTGNLDSQTGKLIFDLLHDLTRTQNTTVIVVTHDLEIAGKTDKTYQLNDGKLQEFKK